MFRESDYRSPKMHESFINKTIPSTQLHAQQSKFDDSYQTKQSATINDPKPSLIPVTHDHYYDPENPNADWAGLVKSISGEKKHVKDHASRKVNLQQNEKGIVAVPADKYEFHKKRNPEYNGRSKEGGKANFTHLTITI